jgi:VIT1/CCC1 family predicted Fe2+/Mn2+ transporter
MVTPDAQPGQVGRSNLSDDYSQPAQAGQQQDAPEERKPAPVIADSLNRTFYIIGAVAAVGCLVVLFATYVIPDLVTLLVGTIILVAAVISWIGAAVYLIARMLKQLFSSRGRTDI